MGKMKGALFAAASALVFSASAELVTYPDYPAQVERDWTYAVRVSQGDVQKRVQVYNHCEKSALTRRTRGGDVNRRFCEFAFSGEPVRVDIAVCEDVKSYKLFPARLKLKSSFKNGVISVWVDQPHHFGVQLNDYDKTTLSVFVDKPEDRSKVPSKTDPKVLFVDGWMDAPDETGAIVVTNQYKEVYIAPGAVLNARLVVNGPKVRVHGRGMILDPMSDIFRYDQMKNTRYGLLAVGDKATGAVIEDVKLIDARTYNYCAWNGTDVTFRNVKAMSSMMCTDGISLGGKRVTVDGAWLYVGDNGLVVSGIRERGRYRDIVIGTSCKAIFPQSRNNDVCMEDVDVFRADEGFVWNSYNPGTNQLSQSFFFKNMSAVDCNLFARFFACGNMGAKPKSFGFENVAIPYSTGSDSWRTTGTKGGATVLVFDKDKPFATSNCVVAVTNLWVAGERCDGFAESEIKGAENISLSVVNTRSESALPTLPNRHEVNWTCPYKCWVGSALQRDVRRVSPKKGEQRLEEPDVGANLLADRRKEGETGYVRSAWQRCPSWMAKLDATEVDGGSRVYRVRLCQKTAGMYNDITDAFLRRGNGTYRLSFEARAKNGEEIPLVASLLSNEKTFPSKFTLPNDGEWHRYEADVKTDFDLAVTELVGLHLKSSANATAEEIDFKNLSFAKVE